MNRPIRALGAAVVVTLVALGPTAAAGGPQPLALDLAGPGWELEGEGAVIEELDERTALRLMSGKATYRGVELLDGTVEFELRVTPHRSFAFLHFRIEDDGEHEEIYFRPHKSGLPDAVQYTPVYKGSSQWQLYHDARSTAPAVFQPGEWTPIKVVVRGSRAAVFVGTVAEPQLVATLARAPRPGYLALRSFKPLGAPPDTHLAEFANVVVHPGVVEYEFPPQAAPEPPAGTISSWQISRAFAPSEGPLTALPPEVLASGEWQTVLANGEGLVELERHLTRPQGVRRAGVLARLEITAAAPAARRLDLGFSDEVSVFLNGRLLATDDDSYSFNLPRRQGLLTADQLSVFLPLERGGNELILAIVDRFGGWGLSGRLADRSGVVIGPPPAGSADGAGQVEAPATGISRLAWLHGCWHGKAGEECWLEPRGGMMIGVNRGPNREDRPPFFELLRIVEDGDGLTLLAQPGGRSPATPFPATEVGDSRVVFANPEHDFPQRITYWFDGETLRARVEARQEGEWRGFEQRWSRGSWSGTETVSATP